MTSHPYLQQGLTILHTRLQASNSPWTHTPGAAALPFVTVSHETGAGATSFAHQLLPLLNEHLSIPDHSWMVLEKDLLHQALNLHHLPEHLANFLPEDRRSEIKGLIGEMVGLHPPLWELEHQVAEAILQMAKLGCVILSGRGANLITRFLPGGIHVRLVAPLEIRIQRVQQMLGYTRDAARQYVREQDAARERHLQTQFEQRGDDPLLYDMVINTERIPPLQAARLTLTALQGKLAVELAPAHEVSRS